MSIVYWILQEGHQVGPYLKLLHWHQVDLHSDAQFFAVMLDYVDRSIRLGAPAPFYPLNRFINYLLSATLFY